MSLDRRGQTFQGVAMRKRQVVLQQVLPQAPAIECAPLPCMALTVEEAGEVLRVSRCMVLDLIGEERLRVVRIGRRVIVPIRAIEEFLNQAPVKF